MIKSKKLTQEETEYILDLLQKRFEIYKSSFPKLNWKDIASKLHQNESALWAILEMEDTGGEPGLLTVDEKTDELIFCDFSKESPKQRRSLCYDQEALESRKKYPPSDSVKDVAAKMGVEVMNESQYRKLQSMGDFDTKTSSWLDTPQSIRDLGGAIFGDYRYGQVFIYHNGAESYYAARGFRAVIKV